MSRPTVRPGWCAAGRRVRSASPFKTPAPWLASPGALTLDAAYACSSDPPPAGHADLSLLAASHHHADAQLPLATGPPRRRLALCLLRCGRGRSRRSAALPSRPGPGLTPALGCGSRHAAPSGAAPGPTLCPASVMQGQRGGSAPGECEDHFRRPRRLLSVRRSYARSSIMQFSAMPILPWCLTNRFGTNSQVLAVYLHLKLFLALRWTQMNLLQLS